MERLVRKRDGNIVPYNREKIELAIQKAGKASDSLEVLKSSKELAKNVEFILEKEFFRKGSIPSVEEIQDAVEKILIKCGYSDTAKAYILYREKRREAREFDLTKESALSLVDEYLEKTDWRVNENSNMTYSLQGLNFSVSGSLVARYWLNKIYPEEIRVANDKGLLHIHDLGVLGPYCVGWSLEDLLQRGFGGVRGKIESAPPRHFRTALGQIVNFFYTLQGEAAGAQAFSNFDTLLAPFIRFDKLSYPEVKQAMQEFIFNLNVPTRVGFQCLSEDTEILTVQGWKSYNDVKKGDEIYTFNIETGNIEKKRVEYVFVREYEGYMYNLRNRNQNQLISPGHRVVREISDAEKYKLESIERAIEFKSPISIPVKGENTNPDIDIPDEQLKLLAWILSESSIEKDASHRVSIYQSETAHPKNYEEIINLLSASEFEYTTKLQTGLETCTYIGLLPNSSKVVHKWLGSKSKKMPSFLFNLSKRQARLFLETYIKGDGWDGRGRYRITVTDEEILKGLEAIAVLAGYNFNVRERKVEGISKKSQHILTLTEIKHDYIQKIDIIEYKGVIWSVHTENETVIAKRDGQVFITGNTPFTNLTFDLVPPDNFKNKNIVYGGKKLDSTYGEFTEEISMINTAFAELMMEGDRKGRIFTFPIPTYNIAKDFDWERDDLQRIWEMTAKYGVPYFANFVNSDMNPEDARSMCLHPDEEVLVTNSDNIKRLSIGELVDKYKVGDFDNEGWVPCDERKNLKMLSLNPKTLMLEWTKVTNFFKVTDNFLVEIETEDRKLSRLSRGHLIPIVTKDGIKIKRAEEISEGDYLLSLKKAQNCLSKNYQKLSDALILDEDLAKILGYFIANGHYLFENRKNLKTYLFPKGLQFKFNCKDKESIRTIKSLLEKRLGCKVKSKKDPRYNTFYLYIYNSSLARAFYNAGFKKYSRLPQILFNSPKGVIEAFLAFHFKGDRYEKRKEIHINDNGLSRDLVLLYSLIGKKVILSKYGAHTGESIRFENSDVYITRVKSVNTTELQKPEVFYDVELSDNHLFVHSLGTISHNCCRLRLDKRELKKKGGGLFGADPLTGSIGVVTLNIPRIAYISRNEDEFFFNLSDAMELAKTSLEIKRKVIENFTERGLYPYSRYYLNNVKRDFGKYWANHFSTIGFIGMNEATLNFLGKPISDLSAKEWVVKVIMFMRDKIRDFQEATDNFYNLEATPAEGASYRLAKKDKEQFGNSIITAGDDEVPYYTNSVHLPVTEEHDVFEVLEHQDDLQTLFTGGTVVHLFLGEAIHDWRMCRELVRKIVSNYKLPYFTLTPTFSVCPVHGYLEGANDFCPKPHTEAELNNYGIQLPETGEVIIRPEVYSRIVGYFRPVENWNKGKKKEFSQRATLKIIS
jgi:ribonucleoside-triphosphate reductase